MEKYLQKWKKIPFQDFSAAASGPTVIYHNKSVSDPGNWGAQRTISNWYQLPNTDCEIKAGGTGGSGALQRYLYRFPLNPVEGQTITMYNFAKYLCFS